ncbi:EAL domain-containing protein [Desulfosporosinus acidiphilus SJ4]|uniref:EAL domain-containing protein n=1 Tax=Desulfosporosinus acidiphilus (strain DSM 22704 / JCM 16185 / SJ4) TaxID=646529 RepID=I4D3U3_DESAJ|nr:EAL domain-containing protein [Desulfosporosinus acidiphilus]AFM40467.1 EAL domain-containing protein [Desulfosporosinus acidiphilus SJ4]
MPLNVNNLTQAYFQILEGKIPTNIALQPIIDLTNSTILGYEALARWSSFSPMEIISLAYHYKGLERLESLIVEAILKSWHRIPGLLFINVHPSIVNPDLWSIFRGRNVVLEITEVETIHWEGVLRLRNMGFPLAIDDLGTGYATFDTLLQLRPEYLKLDKVLTQSIHVKARNSLLTAMVDHARRLGSKVIAEGIETKEQWQAAQESGCHFGQGYFLGKPQLFKRNRAIMRNDEQENEEGALNGQVV